MIIGTTEYVSTFTDSGSNNTFIPPPIKVSPEPATCVDGSPLARVAEAQLDSVIGVLPCRYLTSYELAVPVVPSSPGAVQVSVMELLVELLTARLDMAAGAVSWEPAGL